MDLKTPVIEITNPKPGQTLRGIVKLEAEASDDVAVSKVDFMIMGKVVKSELTAPFSANFDSSTLKDGTYSFQAVAYDQAGNSAMTVCFDIKVDNSVITPPVDPGWTALNPTDTLKIYVSSSGSDANDGMSESKPLKTLAAGYRKLRSGKPDWLLLKCGDTFKESFPYWDKGGKSESEPMLISSYGSGERPIVSAVGSENVLVTRGDISFVALIGLRITNLQRVPGTPGFNADLKSDTGVRWMSKGQCFLIEDCLIDYHRVGVVLEQSNFKNLKIRRSVIANNWAKESDGHSQGLYIENVDQFLLEECFLDENGYHKDVKGAGPTIFNHGCYTQVETSKVVVKDNIFARASATGIQMRSGGLCEGNLFLRNPIGLTFGLVYGLHAALPGGVSGAVHANVFLEGCDISDALPRGNALALGNDKDVLVVDNVFALRRSQGKFGAIEVDGDNGDGIQRLVIKDNACWKYDPFLKVSGKQGQITQSNNVTSGFPKPDQDLDSYDASFLAKARRQSKANWDKKITASEAIKYFRSGFGR